MTEKHDDLICTVTPTIADGTVVRWYRDLTDYEHREPFLSASRNGVAVSCFLHQVPPGVLGKANEAFEILRDDGPRELVQDMATHRRRSFMNPELVPILREPE